MDFLEELTTKQKIETMVEFFGITEEEAREQLEDMGEI